MLRWLSKEWWSEAHLQGHLQFAAAVSRVLSLRLFEFEWDVSAECVKRGNRS